MLFAGDGEGFLNTQERLLQQSQCDTRRTPPPQSDLTQKGGGEAEQMCDFAAISNSSDWRIVPWSGLLKFTAKEARGTGRRNY